MLLQLCSACSRTQRHSRDTKGASVAALGGWVGGCALPACNTAAAVLHRNTCVQLQHKVFSMNQQLVKHGCKCFCLRALPTDTRTNRHRLPRTAYITHSITHSKESC